MRCENERFFLRKTHGFYKVYQIDFYLGIFRYGNQVFFLHFFLFWFLVFPVFFHLEDLETSLGAMRWVSSPRNPSSAT